MKNLLRYFTFLVLLVSTAKAEDRPAPTDSAIIKSCGIDLATLFSKFGPPSDIVPARGETKETDRVLCDYDTFMFSFRDQKVVGCFFRKTWKGSIMGIKIGDTREAVAKVLGAASDIYKDKNGAVADYGYVMKNLGVTFYANFDPKSGTLTRVEIEPLN